MSDTDDILDRLDRIKLAAYLAGANQRRTQPATPDDPNELRRRLDQARIRSTTPEHTPTTPTQKRQ